MVVFSLAELQAPPFPAGVNVAQRELYLSDAEFESTMECTRAAFAQLPKWKRDNKKRQAKLF